MSVNNEEVDIILNETTEIGSTKQTITPELLDDSITRPKVVDAVNVEIETSEWIVASDAILIQKYVGDIPQWLEDIINDNVDFTDIIDSIQDLQDQLDLLGEGYTNLIAITDDQAVKLEYLASQQDGMAASIQELWITKITEDEAIAISKETIGAWLESGEAGSWFDRMISVNASLTSANATAISNLHSELDGIDSDIEEIMKTSVTKTQNPLWVDDCNYLADPACEPSDPDQFGNPRWIYTAAAQYQLLVDANGNVAGLDIFACDSTDPAVECETVFSIFANKFVVKANPEDTASISPFVINTNTTPATIAFNGEVHFLNPDDGTSSPLYDYLNELSDLIQENKDAIQDAMDRISEIVGGMVITIDEKKQLRIELDKIKEQNTMMVNQYAIYNVVPGDGQYPNFDQYDVYVDELEVYLVTVILIDDLTQEHTFADDGEYNEFVQKFENVYIYYGLSATGLMQLAKDSSEDYADQILDDISIIVSDEVVNGAEKRQLQVTLQDMKEQRNSLVGSYERLGYFLPQAGNDPDPEVQYLYNYDIEVNELDDYLTNVVNIGDTTTDTNLIDVGSSPTEFVQFFADVFEDQSLAQEHLIFIVDAKAYGYADSAYRRAQDMSLDGKITVEEKRLLQLDYDRIIDLYNSVEAKFSNIGIVPCPTYDTDPDSCPPYSINLAYYQQYKDEVVTYLDTVIGIHDDPLVETPLNDDEVLEFNDKFYKVYHYQELSINDYTVAYDQKLRDAINEINQKTEEISSDGWIHPSEKLYLRDTLTGIQNNYTAIESSFAWLGIDPTTPADSPFPGSPGGANLALYQSAINALTPYLTDTDKCNINESVATELASFGSSPDEFNSYFDDVFIGAQAAASDLTEAIDVKLQGQIDDAIDDIEAIAGDDLITIGEKSELQITLAKIINDLTALRGQFFVFGVDNPDATYPPASPPPDGIENQKLFDYQIEVASINALLMDYIEITNGQEVYLSDVIWEGNNLTPQAFIDEFAMLYSKQQTALEELMVVADAYYQGQFNLIENELNDIDVRLTQAEQDIIDLENTTSLIGDDGWVVVKEKKDLRIVHADLQSMHDNVIERYAVYGVNPGDNPLLDDVIAAWDILDPYMVDTDKLYIFAADDVITDTELTAIGSSRDDYNLKFSAMYDALNAVLDDIDSIINTDIETIENNVKELKILSVFGQEHVEASYDDGIVDIQEKEVFVAYKDVLLKEYQLAVFGYQVYGINPGEFVEDQPIYAQPHQEALNWFQTEYNNIIDYLENTLMVDDLTTDTPIPDEQEYIDKFTAYYTRRDACYELMQSISFDDIGAPDGGTIIHGDHILTGTVDAQVIKAHTLLTSPRIEGGDIYGINISGAHIFGSNIEGGIIRGSYIDFSDSGVVTDSKVYHDGTPDPGGVPNYPPANTEDNFVKNSDGSLMTDAEGYYRLYTEQYQQNIPVNYSEIIDSIEEEFQIQHDNIDLTGVYNYDQPWIPGSKVIHKIPQFAFQFQPEDNPEYHKFIDVEFRVHNATQKVNFIYDGSFYINQKTVNLHILIEKEFSTGHYSLFELRAEIDGVVYRDVSEYAIYPNFDLQTDIITSVLPCKIKLETALKYCDSNNFIEPCDNFDEEHVVAIIRLSIEHFDTIVRDLPYTQWNDILFRLNNSNFQVTIEDGATAPWLSKSHYIVNCPALLIDSKTDSASIDEPITDLLQIKSVEYQIKDDKINN